MDEDLTSGDGVGPGAPLRLRGPAFGLGLRRELFDGIFEPDVDIDFVEILPENFMGFGGRPQEVLEHARERWPVLVHGVSLSLGGPDPLDEAYLDDLARILRRLEAPWFSDHLSFSKAHGVAYHDLLPLPFTEEAVRHVTNRIRQVQDRMGRPFLVENPSYYVALAGAEMTEAEFVREVVTRADCGLLLDVNNVYVNARNHGYDAHAFLDAMPAGRVLEYHVAGHDDSGPFLVDSHGTPVRDEVYALYEYAVRTLGPAWTLLERDNAVPPVPDLLREVSELRRAAARGTGARRPAALSAATAQNAAGG